MSIIQIKIDEIRRKPEHIRVRYAWMYTAIAMVFVILIWVISFSAGKNDSSKENPAIIQPEVLSQFQEGKKSLEDTTDQMKGTFQEIGRQIPQDNDQNQIPKSSEIEKFDNGTEGFGR